MQATIIIPARYESVRFPGKPLADRTGRPLIQHVHERVSTVAGVNRVIVATDDARIRSVVEAFGGEVVMTRRDHPNGTSRIAEVAARLEDSLIVNVQGDEPEIDPTVIEGAVESLIEHPECVMSTLAAPFEHDEDPADPNMVKVVLDHDSRALYFSRALIPHNRDGERGTPPLRHVGLYVYRRDFLLKYIMLPPTPLESAEKLEQLRVLEHGFRISVARVKHACQGIDTPEQYDAFVRRYLATSAG